MLFTKGFIAARSIAIAITRAIFQSAANAFHMVVVTFLRQTNLILKPEYLFAIFAHLAVHDVLTIFNLVHTVFESRQNKIMVIEVSRFQKFNLGIAGRNIVRERIDTFDQYPCEQEIRKNNNAFIAKLGCVFEARLNQWEGHTRVANLSPTKAKAFP